MKNGHDISVISSSPLVLCDYGTNKAVLFFPFVSNHFPWIWILFYLLTHIIQIKHWEWSTRLCNIRDKVLVGLCGWHFKYWNYPVPAHYVKALSWWAVEKKKGSELKGFFSHVMSTDQHTLVGRSLQPHTVTGPQLHWKTQTHLSETTKTQLRHTGNIWTKKRLA